MNEPRFVNQESVNNFKSYNNSTAISSHSRNGLKPIEKKIIMTYFKKPGRVLDLGCGLGRTSLAMAKLGYQVVAIDYAPLMIKAAKLNAQNENIRYMVADVSRLPFKSNEFDHVLFSFNGLDYLYPETERIKGLSEIHRVLKPGGHFAFSSHNSFFVPNTIGRMVGFAKTLLLLKITPYRWDFQVFGPLLTKYSSPPSVFSSLSKIGFEQIRLLSEFSTKYFKITLSDPYPYYVCVKQKISKNHKPEAPISEPFFEPIFRRLRFRKVLREIKPNSVVVDVGCGHTPHLLNKLSYFVKSAIGIDQLIKSSHNGNIKIISQLLATRIPLPNDLANHVTLSAVLEHLENPDELLKECHRILKKNGTLILTTPSPLSKPILEILSFRLGLVSKREIAEHKRYYTKQSLLVAAKKAGFKKIRHRYFEFFCNNFLVATK